jgi:hypothetical protein
MYKINSFTITYQTMDELDDDTMDTYSGYSDNERYQNYMQIVDTLKFFENNGHITEDWMEEHKWTIEKWRDWIDDYSQINSEVTEKAFRKACSEIETIISYLIKSIRATKTFDTKVYYILLQKMKYICDNLFTAAEMEELMNGMSLK